MWLSRRTIRSIFVLVNTLIVVYTSRAAFPNYGVWKNLNPCMMLASTSISFVNVGRSEPQ